MNCWGLNTLTLSSGITSIEEQTFASCSKLSSVSIPESVTSIGSSAFSGSGLTTLSIPNSVTTIGEQAFYKCSKLTDVILPENLTMIKKQTFQYCGSLKTITIPAKTEYIYQQAFANCALENVKARPTTPPFAYDNSFSNYNIPLFIPETSATTYQTTNPWSNFNEFKTLSGEVLEIKQCATPTISLKNGKLHFECETEGVEYIYSFTPPAASTNQNGNDVDLPNTYVICVYAKKDGYVNSEIATKNIILTLGEKGDVNQDGVVSITDAVSVVNLILEGGATAPEMEKP